MKAMIFAAGLGTRLKPFTDNHPKALAVVGGKPLLQRNIEYLKSYGIREFIINVHHYPDQILSFLRENEDFGCKITISNETDALLETGGGLKKAAPFLSGGGAFIVMNVDILTNLDLGRMIFYHNLNPALATLAVTDRTSSRYFLFNRQNQLCGWKNTKTGEEKIPRQNEELHPMAFSGIHILEPAVFDFMHQNGKFSMVDVYLDLCSTKPIFAFDHSSDILIDVGKPEAVEEAERLFS